MEKCNTYHKTRKSIQIGRDTNMIIIYTAEKTKIVNNTKEIIERRSRETNNLTHGIQYIYH